MWSLVVNPLLLEIEAICDQRTPGAVATSVTYADDLNFAIRGPDPHAAVQLANRIMACVDRWSRASGIPMGKLQACWINQCMKSNWSQRWTANDGEVICGALRVVPGVEPVKVQF